MLLSMTGYGEAHRAGAESSLSVEVRTINSRHFKLSLRTPEGWNALEPRLEQLVRAHVRRGTVQLNLKISSAPSVEVYRMHPEVLRGYQRQLEAVCGEQIAGQPQVLAALLALPGVVEEHADESVDTENLWPEVEATANEAIRNLTAMRRAEGEAMAHDLLQNARGIEAKLEQIAGRAPLVVEAYREKLAERVARLLANQEVELQGGDLAREVALFADRCDISEEIVRLRSHLAQFKQLLDAAESQGKKLEFLTQEMFRETNTIGSKANDGEIAHRVVDIKTALERVREMIQNVE